MRWTRSLKYFIYNEDLAHISSFFPARYFWDHLGYCLKTLRRGTLLSNEGLFRPRKQIKAKLYPLYPSSTQATMWNLRALRKSLISVDPQFKDEKTGQKRYRKFPQVTWFAGDRPSSSPQVTNSLLRDILKSHSTYDSNNIDFHGWL